MAVFNFDQVDDYVQSSGEGFSFFKLQDNGWMAKVRFMYGPGEVFKGYSVHKVTNENGKSKMIPCLRGLNDPLESCPLCKAGMANQAQFYIPLYVISITKCINGALQPEEPVNQIMIFQRGKTFQGSLSSVIRQSQGTPIVNNVFNIVRNGKAGDKGTTYAIEFVSRDNTTLEQLGEVPQIEGSYILPNVSYDDMYKYITPQNNTPSGVVPRTVSASSYSAPQQNYQSNYQAPPQAPGIPF